MRYIAFLGLYQIIGTSVLFAVTWFLLRERAPMDPAARKWLVLTRGSSVRAIPSGVWRRSYWTGYWFAGLYYYAFPIWLWLWGWRRATLLVAGSFLAAALLSKVVVVPLIDAYLLPVRGRGSLTFTLFVGATVLIPGRAICGWYVAKHHNKFRQLALERRGWKVVRQDCAAASASEACRLHGEDPTTH